MSERSPTWAWWPLSESQMNRRIRAWSVFFAIMMWPIFALIAFVQRVFAILKRLTP